MRPNRIFLKGAIYFFIILISSFIAFMTTEVILGKELYTKKIDPEPFVATINEQGFRVRSADDIYSKNSGGYYRLICLGDSFTYGHGVADDKTYPVFLEKYLEDICQKKIQVINAGVRGATITEELYMYIKNCAQLQSNLVVLLIRDGDISYDLTKILLLKTQNNFFGMDKYLRGSKVYSLIKLNILRQQENDVESYYTRHKEYVVNKYLEGLEELNKIVKSNNSDLVVVIFEQGEDIKALKSFCKNRHIPVVDITIEYAQRAAQGGIHLIHHLNEIGNNFLAKAIAQKLSEKISVNNNPQ